MTNQPGLTRLAYRSGTHSSVLERMLGSLPRALPGLAARSTDDAAVALLDAWATVADVVTFYTERIANEGFLRTATERRSVLELARAIGYELRPGVAASTHLAFAVETADGAPHRAVVPQGTQVRSVPGQGQRPQTFETSQELVVLAARNEVGLRTRRPQTVGPGCTRLHLAGVTTGLRPGDALLVVRGLPGRDPVEEFRILLTVTPLPAVGPGEVSTTLVTWQDGLGDAPVAWQRHPFVCAFRLRASIFGSSAPDWRTMPDVVRARYVPRPAPAQAGTEVAAAPTADDFTTWPGFELPSGDRPAVIDLDGQFPTLATGSRLVLTQPEGPPAAGGEVSPPTLALTSVLRAELGARDDFGITARTTAVLLAPTGGLASFDRRRTTVWTQTETLALAEEPIDDAVTGADLELVRDVPIEAGQLVVVEGEDAGSGGHVTQVVPVDQVYRLPHGMRVHLHDPLTAPLVAGSVRVLGNVVAATHGETVDDEVLGGGDGGAAYQRFTLSKPELTHLAAATAGGVESTLQVWVDDVRWAQVPSLFVAGPQDHVYVVRIDDDARATVVFGDGERGSRLPTGQENVHARYRSGIGPAGEVAAGSLSLLQQRPLGVTAVSNPVASGGSAAPESLEDARANAPRTVLTLDRVVSLRDHEDFARGFAGIAKAGAAVLWGGTRPFVHLTVAAPEGRAASDTTVARLHEAIAGLGDGASGLRIDSYGRLPFVVGVAVLVDATHRAATVHAAVAAALRAAFAFDRRSFAQPVTTAEVVSVAAAVDGVVALTVTALHLATEAPAVHALLPARPARPAPAPDDPRHVAAAELLLIDAVTVSELAP